ncbi:manganese efflux pump MntP [Bacillaceae bacterium W0354]
MISLYESLAPLLLLAVAIGMDAFSVSLSVGLMKIRLRIILLYIILIGLFHVIMPFMGMIVGHFLSNKLGMIAQIVGGWMLIMIGAQMIIATLIEKETLKQINFLGLLALAFTVSLDSFSVGISIGMTMFGFNQIAVILLFGLMSMFLATLGLYLAKKGKTIFGKYSEAIGGIVLVFIGLQMIM